MADTPKKPSMLNRAMKAREAEGAAQAAGYNQTRDNLNGLLKEGNFASAAKMFQEAPHLLDVDTLFVAYKADPSEEKESFRMFLASGKEHLKDTHLMNVLEKQPPQQKRWGILNRDSTDTEITAFTDQKKELAYELMRANEDVLTPNVERSASRIGDPHEVYAVAKNSFDYFKEAEAAHLAKTQQPAPQPEATVAPEVNVSGRNAPQPQHAPSTPQVQEEISLPPEPDKTAETLVGPQAEEPQVAKLINMIEEAQEPLSEEAIENLHALNHPATLAALEAHMEKFSIQPPSAEVASWPEAGRDPKAGLTADQTRIAAGLAGEDLTPEQQEFEALLTKIATEGKYPDPEAAESLRNRALEGPEGLAAARATAQEWVKNMEQPPELTSEQEKRYAAEQRAEVEHQQAIQAERRQREDTAIEQLMAQDEFAERRLLDEERYELAERMVELHPEKAEATLKYALHSAKEALPLRDEDQARVNQGLEGLITNVASNNPDVVDAYDIHAMKTLGTEGLNSLAGEMDAHLDAKIAEHEAAYAAQQTTENDVKRTLDEAMWDEAQKMVNENPELAEAGYRHAMQTALDTKPLREGAREDMSPVHKGLAGFIGTYASQNMGDLTAEDIHDLTRLGMDELTDIAGKAEEQMNAKIAQENAAYEAQKAQEGLAAAQPEQAPKITGETTDIQERLAQHQATLDAVAQFAPAVKEILEQPEPVAEKTLRKTAEPSVLQQRPDYESTLDGPQISAQTASEYQPTSGYQPEQNVTLDASAYGGKMAFDMPQKAEQEGLAGAVSNLEQLSSAEVEAQLARQMAGSEPEREEPHKKPATLEM